MEQRALVGLALALSACTSPPVSEPPVRMAAPVASSARAEAEPAPAVEPPPAPPPEPEPGTADTDPNNDGVVAPPEAIPDCAERLEAAGVKFKPAKLPVKQAGRITCGAPDAVTVLSGPTGVRYNVAPLTSCSLALALAHFEALLQEEAQRVFGVRVKRINQGGTYSCRKMARFSDMVSEHSYANAIDLLSFTLENGKNVSVKRHYGKPDAEPATEESRFLRKLANRAFDEGVFSVVLTPKFDKLHADHFHVDMARYRVDGSR